MQLADARERRERLGIDAEPRAELEQDERREPAPGGAEAKRDAFSAAASMSVYTASSIERTELERRRGQHGRGAAERDADRADRLARKSRGEPSQRRRRVHRLEVAEGDVLAAALALGLEVEREHRVARVVEEARARDHLRAVGADAVHQEDRAAARPARHEPAAELGTRSARKGDRLAGEPVDGRGELRPVRRDQARAQQPECRGSEGERGGDEAYRNKYPLALQVLQIVSLVGL